MHPRASTAAEDRGGTKVGGFANDGATGRPDTKARRCIFVNTGTNTIVIDVEAEHTSVDHVRAQVQEREGITPDHQRLIYAGKQWTRGDLRLEDYGVTERATLHLLGRIRGGMPEDSGDGPSGSKRPHLALEDPMDVEAAGLDPMYAQWKLWFEKCATTFLAPEAKVAEALGYRDRATRQFLIEAGVREMVHRAV